MVISSFSGEYRFLSNFYPCTILYDGLVYRSTEHAFQAAKTLSKAERADIRAASTPGKAKRLGRRLKLRPGWDRIKDGIMFDLLRQKFENVELMIKLVDTEDAQLVEGNYWHDNYWGVCFCGECDNSGDNMLGKLLMKVRDEVNG